MSIVEQVWSDIFLKHNLEMIPKDFSLDMHWSMFENAATFSYARLISAANKRRIASDQDQNLAPMTISTATALKYNSISNSCRQYASFSSSVGLS